MSQSQLSKHQVATAIVTYNGRILLLQRDDKPEIKDPGKWQLPGGGVEYGETPEEAMRRELKEEIGIDPKNIKSLGEWETGTFVYHASLSSEEAAKVTKGEEGEVLLFFTLSEMHELPLTPKLRFALSLQEKFLESLLSYD